MIITVRFSYPNTIGTKFDMNYFLGTHFELVDKCWENKLISARDIKGILTPASDTPTSFQVAAS